MWPTGPLLAYRLWTNGFFCAGFKCTTNQNSYAINWAMKFSRLNRICKLPDRVSGFPGTRASQSKKLEQEMETRFEVDGDRVTFI